jgi:hypothetical protein
LEKAALCAAFLVSNFYFGGEAAETNSPEGMPRAQTGAG